MQMKMQSATQCKCKVDFSLSLREMCNVRPPDKQVMRMEMKEKRKRHRQQQRESKSEKGASDALAAPGIPSAVSGEIKSAFATAYP